MQGAAFQDKTDLSVMPPGFDLDGVTTVVGLAPLYEHIGAVLAAANERLAELTGGGADDARPALSAIEVMAAVGRVHHGVTVAAALGQAQVDVTNAHLEDGLRNARTWVERQTGISPSAVREADAVIRCLKRYPEIRDAFLAGRLRAAELVQIDRIIPKGFFGPAKAEAIEFLRDVQSWVIQAAEVAFTLKDFARFCTTVQARIDSDGVEPTTPGAGESELSLRQLADGRWELRGRLNPDDGAIMKTQLEEKDQANLRSRKDDPDLKGTKDERCTEVRHAQALMQLLLAGAGAHRPGRVGVFLHISLEDLEGRGAETPGPMARTEANYDVSEDTLWALLADADVTPIITSGGTPLSYGRTRRLAPDMLRRAMAFRDRTCWVPGCDVAPCRHDLHHLKLWMNGGTTDPFNEKGGCRLHHHCVHDRGWQVIAPPDGAPGDAIVIKPDGSIYDPTPLWRQQRDQPLDDVARRRLAALRDELPRTDRRAG